MIPVQKSFGEVVLFARTGLNPRTNFKLGQGTNKYITIKNIHNNTLVIDDATDVVDDAAISMIHRRSQIKAGDILFCSIGRLGDMYIIKEEPVGWDVNESVFVFTLDTSIIRQKYFYYLFKHRDIIEYLTANSSGSTFKSIKMNQLQKMVFDLPSLAEQDKIVACLDSVTETIEIRSQQLLTLDTLIKARFVEMFGVFPENPMGWETGTIRDVVSDVRYGSSRPAVEGGKYPYLRMNNITYGGELDLTDTKRIDVPESELEKCTVRRGDVLFNRTNSKELVGKTCVYNRNEMMVLAGFVIRVRLNERMLPEFLSAFLNTDFSKAMLLGMCKAAIGQANINAQEMQSIGIYIPPIEKQREFVLFKAQIEKSKAAVQQSLAESQLLFDSLMQKYFG